MSRFKLKKVWIDGEVYWEDLKKGIFINVHCPWITIPANSVKSVLTMR